MRHTKELWKPVVGYEGRYEVSSFGRVRSFLSCRGRVGGLLYINPKTLYPMVGLTRDGKTKTHYIHQLILEAFVGPRPFFDAQARHLDGNKWNSVLSNLCWGTRKENCEDALKHGARAMGERNGHAKLKAHQVIEIRCKGAEGMTQTEIAKQYNVTPWAITEILDGRNWKHV